MPTRMTLNAFKKELARVQAAGWIPSERRGPTGIGKTFEHWLGIQKNNIAFPDLGRVELKTHRIGSSSLITLSTFNRKVWKMNPWEAIQRHGTPDANGRLGLYFTMSRTPNSTDLFLYVQDTSISVRHVSGQVLAEWQLETLAERFMQKLPQLILVSAFSEMRGDIEWFKYDRARLLTGTSPQIIRNQMYAGNVIFDLRITQRASIHEARFVADDANLCWLFTECREI